MKRQPSHSVATYDAAGRFDLVLEWLLLALLAFMPFAFGAVQAWSEQVVLVLAAAMALVLSAKLIFCRGARFAWTWGLLPPALFLALVALQLVPLSAQLLGGLSPATTGLRQELLADVPNASAVLARQTLSLYPHATRHDLAMLLAVVTVFVTVLNVHRRTHQVKRLLLGVAVIGLGVGLLGFWQWLRGATAIYGSVPTANGAAGPFINHSHFGQFMNLSIGAALGLLLIYVEEIFGRGEVSLPAFYERLREGKVRIAWGLVGVIVLLGAMVFLSMTRGGMVSLLVAGSLTAVALTLSRRQAGRASLLVLLGFALFLGLLYAGFDAVYDRAASIAHVEKSEGGRGQILRDLTQAWKKFPVFGTGLGTHETVFPMFDRSNMSSLATHAENEYAQLMEETGLLGVSLALAFLAWVAWTYRQSIRRSAIPVQAAAYGLGFGVAAILIHSFTDFGQHVPANACLTAASVALLANLSWRAQSSRAKPIVAEQRPARLWLPLGAAVPLGLAALLIWNLPLAEAARKAENRWAAALEVEAELEANGWHGSDDRFRALIENAQAAAELLPTSIHYQYGLNAYRWRAISRARDAETGNLLMTEQSLGFARRIVDELHRIRPLCPTFGMTYSLAGQIETFVLADPAGPAHLRRGYALSSWDPDAAAAAATLDADEGVWDAAVEKFRAAVERGLPPSRALEVLLRGGRADLAMALAQGNSGSLGYVANYIEKTQSNPELVAEARAAARKLLEDACARPDAAPTDIASLAAQCVAEGNHDRAIELYRRALSRNYDNVAWRMGLARALAQVGQTQPAMHEARICLRLRPQYAAAESLIGELSVRRGAGGGE